jgi:cyclic beta-1,2-glucan synthetase
VALADAAAPGDDPPRADDSPPADEAGSPPEGPSRDPGYYLISDGRVALEHALRVKVPLSGRLRRAYVRTAVGGYLGTIALVTALALAVPLLLGGAGGAAGAGVLAVAILALGPASDLALALVNRSVTNVLGPRPLARLDLDAGVPSELRTLVVVPMLLTSEADVEAQVSGLEVHYLGNREGDRFALLRRLDARRSISRRRRALSAACGHRPLNDQHGEAPGRREVPALPSEGNE